jgi:hypothetical protein
MKLLTEMSGEGDDILLVYNGDINVSTDDQVEHDAAAAHALTQAMRQYEQDFPFSPAVAQDVIQWIEKRADELMREWGYSRECGES